MKKFALCAAFLLGMLPALFGGKIDKVVFEQIGIAKIDEKILRMNIQSKEGTVYNPATVDEDIKRLYQTGYFSDIKASESATAAKTSAIIFTLTLKPLVKEVIFEGNVKFNTKTLQSEITLDAGGPLNDAKLRESAQKLREFYHGKGYNQATVTPKIVSFKDDPSRVNVVFAISESLRLKVDHVTFENNTVYSSWTLKDVMANRYSIFSRFFELGLYDKNELELDKLRIRELYLEKGYLDFKVEDVKITPDPEDPEYVNIHMILNEGEPYSVGNIVINGGELFPASDLLKLIPLESGKVFSSKDETAARQRISALYDTRGYVDFFCKVDRAADYNTHKVDLVFTIQEGRKYYVSNVHISGNTDTKDKVIRRELAIQPGDPVDKRRLEASKARLMGMGYFNKVDINTVNADKINEKNVDIKVEEKPDRFNPKIGVGFSDVNNLVGMAEISSNNFDLFNPGNLFYGGGQKLRLRGMLGIDSYGFNLDFTEPWFMDRKIRFDLSLYYNEFSYDKWDETRAGVRTAFTHRVFDDFTNLTLGYKFEQVNLKNMSKHTSQEMHDELGRDWVSQFSAMLERDTRNSIMEPTRGYNANLLAAISPRIAGSSNNFYRLEAKGSYYYPLWDEAVVIMVGGKIGAVSDFNREEQVPMYERYFLGGGDTLRGFPYREVSPVDQNGDNIGGQSMLLLTSEISHPIWKFIRGAVFIDVGNAWKKAYNYNFSQINVGLGYGLRIKVPFFNAPIKLDLAYPIVNNQDDLDSKLRFHFNMGFTW